MPTLLLFTAPAANGPLLAAVLAHAGLALGEAEVVTGASAATAGALPSAAAHDAAVSVSHTPGGHTTSYLSALARALRPGAALTLLEPAAASTAVRSACAL